MKAEKTTPCTVGRMLSDFPTVSDRPTRSSHLLEFPQTTAQQTHGGTNRQVEAFRRQRREPASSSKLISGATEHSSWSCPDPGANAVEAPRVTGRINRMHDSVRKQTSIRVKRRNVVEEKRMITRCAARETYARGGQMNR